MSTRTVLIADDEVNLCKILGAEFKKAGYSVTAVHDGAQAIEQARASEFQVIILDVRMPILDGLSALREIRKIRKETPVIVMTAYENQDTMASALSLGATACVNKPFDLESLVSLVRATADRQNGQEKGDWSASVRTVLFSKDQPVWIEIHEGQQAGRYQSRIEVKDDYSLTILCPQRDDGVVMPRLASSVSMGFAGEDAFYSFESTVIATREGPVPAFRIGKPAVIYRVQRRKHARVRTGISVEITLLGKGIKDNRSTRIVSTRIADVSLGGARIVADARIEEGIEILISSKLPDSLKFQVKGKVVRAEKTSAGWEHGIRFTDLDNEARQAIQALVETASD